MADRLPYVERDAEDGTWWSDDGSDHDPWRNVSEAEALTIIAARADALSASAGGES